MQMPLTDDEIAKLLDKAEEYRSVLTVKAVQLDHLHEWTTAGGDELRASVGDWLLEVGRERWTVAGSVFADTYEAVGEGLYRKVASVRAARVDRPILVRTLEGLARAEPGDWLLVNPGGESWPVSAAEFARRYEPVE